MWPQTFWPNGFWPQNFWAKRGTTAPVPVASIDVEGDAMSGTTADGEMLSVSVEGEDWSVVASGEFGHALVDGVTGSITTITRR